MVLPIHLAGNRLRIRIDEQLVGIEAQPLLRTERAMDAIAVELPRLQAGHVAVPDEVGLLFYINAFGLFAAAAVKQAELYPLSFFRIEREVHPRSVPCGPLLIRTARKNFS